MAAGRMFAGASATEFARAFHFLSLYFQYFKLVVLMLRYNLISSHFAVICKTSL